MGKATRCLWERCLIFFYLLKLYGDVVSSEGLTGAGAFFPQDGSFTWLLVGDLNSSPYGPLHRTA